MGGLCRSAWGGRLFRIEFRRGAECVVGGAGNAVKSYAGPAHGFAIGMFMVGVGDLEQRAIIRNSVSGKALNETSLSGLTISRSRAVGGTFSHRTG